MIKKSVFENEIIENMQKELVLSTEQADGINNLNKAVDYLQAAMETFEESGLQKQSEAILQILGKMAGRHMKPHKNRKPKDPRKINDPHTKGLTPEKMVANLLHHGTEFNMTDDATGIDDLLNADIDAATLEVSDADNPSEIGFEDEI